MNETIDLWTRLVALCEAYGRALPHAEPPPVPVSWADPKKHWKNVAERQAVVDEYAQLGEEVIELLLAEKPIPRRAAKGVFFARERLRHACRVAAILATMPQTAPELSVPDIPTDFPTGTIRWLAIDTYNAGHLSEYRWENAPPDF